MCLGFLFNVPERLCFLAFLVFDHIINHLHRQLSSINRHPSTLNIDLLNIEC